MRPVLAAVTALCALGGAASAIAQPSIQHVGLECVAPGQFAVVLSGIDPGDEIETAKTYFRSSLFPDFYYVEMTYTDGRFVGILPQPSPETSQIVYYLEAVDGAFGSARTPDFESPVRDPCNDRPAAAYLPQGDPGIVVGATTAGQSALPPGFSTAGIIGTIASTGVSSGVGGGISTGVAVAAAASAAGVAGAVVATSPSPASGPTTTAPNSPAPTTIPGQTTTTSAGPSTTTTVGGGASTTTTTASVPTTTTTSPSTSTTTIGGPSTTTSAASTTTTSVLATTTTSSVSTTTTTAAAGLNASCFTVQVLAPCQVRVDATCVALPVDQYEWTLDQNDRWQRADFPNGPATFVHTFGNCGASQVLRFRLKVHRGGSSDVSHLDIFVTGTSLKAPSHSDNPVTFETHLDLPPFDGSTRGRILLEGAGSRFVDSAQPAVVSFRTPSGENRIEAILLTSGSREGVWRFEFSGDPRLVPGSIRVLDGNAVATGPASIAFRLEGRAGERVQFTFELAP